MWKERCRGRVLLSQEVSHKLPYAPMPHESCHSSRGSISARGLAHACLGQIPLGALSLASAALVPSFTWPTELLFVLFLFQDVQLLWEGTFPVALVTLRWNKQ